MELFVFRNDILQMRMYSHSYMCANSEGSGVTSRMRSRARALAVRMR